MRRLGAIWLALAIAMVADRAAAQDAPDTATCVAAFDRGQRAQSDRALRRAMSELIVCSQESCPQVLRADCAGVLAEVRAALPTVVFAADDGGGHELTDVKVYASGELLLSELDGRAIPIDPGTLELRFERAGAPPVTTSRIIREGEKSRVLRVSLPGAAERGGRVGPDVAAPASAPLGPAKRSAIGWAVPGSLAALGVTGLGMALYTRLRFDGRVDDLRASCAPECTQSQRSDLSDMVVTSNVLLGVGVGALALAVTSWVLTAPSPREGARPSRSTSMTRVGTWVW